MTVGWYVHHHGAGHLARLRAVAPSLSGVVALSSLEPADPPCPWVVLPRDDGVATDDETAHGTLHWVPSGHPGLRERMAGVASWIAEARPAVFVVDVSVEVALLARLLGVPTVVVAQRGRRDDAPHALAYAQAAAIAAPWTAATHVSGSTLPAERLHFCGAVSRLDDLRFAPLAPGGDVALLLGAGGHGLTGGDVAAAAGATPDRRWHVAGPLRCAGPGVVDHGPRADVAALLRHCSVVVGSAGGNVVAEVAAARRAFVCLPQERPFDEQHEQAAALARLGIAEVRATWPASGDWAATLAAAEARDLGRWGTLHDGRGAQRLVDVVTAVATALPTPEKLARPDVGGSSPSDPPTGTFALQPPKSARHNVGGSSLSDPPTGTFALQPPRSVRPAPAGTPRVAVVTLARGRAAHLRRQAEAVGALDPAPCAYVVLSLDPEPPQVPGAEVLHRPIADGAPLPLAAARNQLIAHVADADLVLCLDVDCVPEPDLLARLAEAADRVGRPAVLAGPVGRLEPIITPAIPAAALARARAVARRGPRPVPAPGDLVDEPRVELFWSLAFAVAPATHARIGGFDEAYVGYGAEDTDYAFRFRRAGVPLVWVGGAWAHHQHHPVSSPPVEHLEAILANARCFRERWGRWPMEGWLREFAARGLVAWAPDGDKLSSLGANPLQGEAASSDGALAAAAP